MLVGGCAGFLKRSFVSFELDEDDSGDDRDDGDDDTEEQIQVLEHDLISVEHDDDNRDGEEQNANDSRESRCAVDAALRIINRSRKAR